MSRNFRPVLSALTMALLLAAQGLSHPDSVRADAYSWEDSAGHKFFGDNPPAGARNVNKLNPKRYSKYSSDKMLAPYRQYVNRPKVSGDLPADGHDLAAVDKDSQTGKGKKGAAKTGSPAVDAAITESNIDLPDTTGNTKESGVPSLADEGGAQGPASQNQSSLPEDQPPKLDPKTDDPDGLNPTNGAQGEEEFPVLLEQGDLSVKHNKKREVTECTVTVFNHGTDQARGVTVAFQFADGTVIPGAGPSSIAAHGQAEYRIPKANLPVAIHAAPADGGSSGPIPTVVIQTSA